MFRLIRIFYAKLVEFQGNDKDKKVSIHDNPLTAFSVNEPHETLILPLHTPPGSTSGKFDNSTLEISVTEDLSAISE